MTHPVLNYFAVRGRGEPIRLALSFVYDGVNKWEEKSVDYTHMKAKAGTAEYPFGQSPTFEHDGMIIAQMDVILRHIGRVNNMCGSTEKEAVVVDMILAGAEDIRAKYTAIAYQNQFSEESVEAFIKKHVRSERECISEQNGGCHLHYLEAMVGRDPSHATTGFAVGGKPSIADAQLFDLVDVILVRPAMGCCDLQKQYPNLMRVYSTFSKLSGVEIYLKSERRCEKVNGNGLG
eukprot:CFRG5591T1